MLRFFLSIKTSLWLTGISIVIFLIGSVYIPRNLDVFSGINETPLFKWLSQNAGDLDKLLWIYILLVLMLLICINMFVCAIDTIMRKISWKVLVEVLSPQILHIGVMFVLFGHLISASTGYKQDIPMDMNTTLAIKGFNVSIHNIEFLKKQDEDSTRWRIHLKINDNLHLLEPARPSFYKGVGFFTKSVEQKKMRIIIGMVYDPGVLWEIIGAVVFVIGAFGIFYLRFRYNDKEDFKWQKA